MSELKVVKTVVKDKEDRILFVQNRDGTWELPGGVIEDESRFQAAERELNEETGLESESFRDVVRIELESSERINCYVVYTSGFSGEIVKGKNFSDVKWIRPGDVKELSFHRDSSYNIVFVDYLEDYLGGDRDYSTGHRIDVAKILVENDEGKFLAVKKNPETKISGGEKYKLYGHMAGKWELPGGRFKKPQNRFDAAERELKEETGLKAEEFEDVVREEVEEANSVNTYILHTRNWEGDITLSKEHTEYRWVTPEEYRELNWHKDAGYGYPPMKFLESYLGEEKSY